MAGQYPIQSSGSKIVIGIDFGTTYSGVAWAATERPDGNVLISDWPSSRSTYGGFSSPKVPTRLHYLNSRQFEWGFQIPHTVPSQNILSLFKLGLEPDRYSRSIDVIGKSLDFDNVDKYITDYLSGIFGHLMNSLGRQLGLGTLRSTSIQFVLTVPAIWSERSKQRTIEAFERVPNLPEDHSTALLSEPEAAAVAALRELDRHNLKIGDSFVVVDAGGGTVDLITYTITALYPVLEVNEASEGTGDFCGSSRLNDRFIQLLKSRLGDEEGWDDDVLHDAVDHFERNTKKRFNMNSLTTNELFTIPVPGLDRNVDLGITRRGRLQLRADEVHMFFEPDILRIIQLVKDQVAVANTPISKILLVGGYGASMYLRERLQLAIQGDLSMGKDIEVLQPPNSWTAVINGAVLKGISLANPVNYDVPVVKGRGGRKHYGYNLGVPFNDGVHDSLRSKRYWDGMKGMWRVAVMQWIIKRGDLVSEDIPFTKDFYISRPVSLGRVNVATLEVYADSTSKEAPLAQNGNVQLLCRATANLDHIPEDQLDRRLGVDGIMYYELEFEIEAVYRSASTEYTLIHKGRRYNTVTAEYV
ncbi:hypothetical protein M426DRAFT_65582 [Hypoxylon sp. CI-4A]|nr:hypothetical protein M426DRAFT_65582 [Hypoxylon sp. CI-4A]